MTTPPGGLSLYAAARAMGVLFATEAAPTDGEVVVNGLRLHYLDWGNEAKPPMLLLHGRTLSSHSWDFTALAFHDDFHVIALDERGHGDSDWAPNGDYTAAAQFPDIEGFMDALNLHSITLIGHSMGGRNSMVYASRHPERVRALVIVDMAPQTGGPDGPAFPRVREGRRDPGFRGARLRPPQEARSFEEYVQAVHAINPRRTLEQLRGSLAHQVRQFPDGKWRLKWDPALRSTDTNGLGAEGLWECFSLIRCPTMLVRGGESGLVSDATVQRMKEYMPTMKSAVVAGAGHGVPGDKPAQFQQEVRQFLATLP